MKSLHVIQINGPEWIPFFGYLPYLRIMDDVTYDVRKGDLLDAEILKTILQSFPSSKVFYSGNLDNEDMLRKKLKEIRGWSQKEIEFQIFPLVAYDGIAEHSNHIYQAHPFKLVMQINFPVDDERIRLINSFFICRISIDVMEQLVSTFQVVQ